MFFCHLSFPEKYCLQETSHSGREAVDVDGWKLEKSQIELVEETEEDLKDAGCNLFPLWEKIWYAMVFTHNNFDGRGYPGISLL